MLLTRTCRVLDQQIGDHVGDWEHTMIRYIDKVPTYVYFSQNDRGTAYHYSALQLTNNRPTNYIALGTHANYPTIGLQKYDDGVFDQTDNGLKWDVLKNFRA